MKYSFYLGVLLSVVLSCGANAATVYNVNLDHGTGLVFGTIETDGTLGSLNPENIVDVDLTLSSSNSQNGSPLAFTGFATAGSLFDATSTDLTFDFTGFTNGSFTAFRFGGFDGYWCLNTLGGSCDGIESASSLGNKIDPNLDIITFNGPGVIASTSPVPIPAAAWLFASALGVFGYLGKRKANG